MDHVMVLGFPLIESVGTELSMSRPFVRCDIRMND